MQHPVLKIQKNAHCASFKSETPTHLAICLSGLSDMESSLHLWLKPKAIEFNFSTSQENKPTDCRTFFYAAALTLPCASTAAIAHGEQPNAHKAVNPATSDTAETPEKAGDTRQVRQLPCGNDGRFPAQRIRAVRCFQTAACQSAPEHRMKLLQSLSRCWPHRLPFMPGHPRPNPCHIKPLARHSPRGNPKG